MTVSLQLRAILIAAALALTAVALGMYTLSQSNKGATTEEPMPPAASLAAPKPGAKPKPVVEAKPKPKPVPNPFVVAARKGGVPAAIAAQLAANEVAVVALYTPGLEIDSVARAEAKAGATAAHVGFVAVDVRAQGTALQLTRSLGVLDSPAVLVYRRPADLFLRLDGYSDSRTIAQAAQNADPTPGGADRSPWARDANTLCAEAAKKIAPLPPTSPQVARVEQETWTQLRGLTPPHDSAAKVTAMLAAYDGAHLARGDRIAASLGASSCHFA
jgi:hypothetical protein